jgi:NitT/TauT family transport system permease protein
VGAGAEHLRGFLGVSETLRMAGRNYGLKGMRFVLFILIPAALPSILAGLKIGWAFAWRTLIAAELVFGATSGKGGLGWYIFQNRNELYTDKVFAGLAVVILIGLLVENLVFDTLERVTVKRWGCSGEVTISGEVLSSVGGQSQLLYGPWLSKL